MMRVGSLFSGIGGMDLGLEWAGMKVVWQVEKNEFCRGVLLRHFPGARLFGDIHDVDPTELEPVDLICGGFPCQPVSLAGKRKGRSDERWLWPAMRDIIRCVSPTWILGENVVGLVTLGLDGVLFDLETFGYTCRTFVIPACAVNAPHRRNRVFIVAHSDSSNCDTRSACEAWKASREAQPDNRSAGIMADTNCWVAQRWRESEKLSNSPESIEIQGDQWKRGGSTFTYYGEGNNSHIGEVKSNRWDGSEWITGADGKSRRIKPGVRLLAHGVSGRVARLKALGNAVVPQLVEVIGRAILAAEREIPRRQSA